MRMRDITTPTMDIIRLRQRPELRRPTADLLNSEWPRSLVARLASLEEGDGDLPCSLVLLQKECADSCEEVVGHVRLIAAAGNPAAVLIEALLVSHGCRGRGYGRRLMVAAEEYATSLNYHTVHLSTHDMQNFYCHLGYIAGPPITALRRCVAQLSQEQAQGILQVPCNSPPPLPPPNSDNNILLYSPSPHPSPQPPPPPPPPPPPLPPPAAQDGLKALSLTWMQKTLTTVDI